MNDVPLIRKIDVNDINISLIAIKKQLKQLNEAVGLIDVPDVDLTPFVRKDGVVNVIEAGNMNPVTSNAVVPTNEVLSGDTRAVTSGAVSKVLSYSTEEVFTGSYWIDGKKIYKKSFYAVITTTSVDVNHNISNIDKVMNAYGFLGADGSCIPSGFYVSSSYYASMSADRTQYHIRTTSAYTNRTYYVTLEYTKTTDTATRSIPIEETRSVEEPKEETR